MSKFASPPPPRSEGVQDERAEPAMSAKNPKKIIVRKRKRKDDDPSEVDRTSQKYYGGRKIRLIRRDDEEDADQLDELRAEQQRLAEQMAALREEEAQVVQEPAESPLPVAPVGSGVPVADVAPGVDHVAGEQFDTGTAYEEFDPQYEVAPLRHKPATIRIDIPPDAPPAVPAGGGGRDMPEDMDPRRVLSDSCRIPDIETEKKLHESQQIILGEPDRGGPEFEREPLFLRHDELGICYVYTYAADSGEESLNTAFETIYRIGLEPPKCFLLPNHIETRNPHLICVNPFLGAEELAVELGYFLMDHKIWRYSEYVMPAGPALRYFWRHLDENGRQNLQNLLDKILRSSGASADDYAMAGVRPAEFIGVTSPFRCQYF